MEIEHVTKGVQEQDRTFSYLALKCLKSGAAIPWQHLAGVCFYLHTARTRYQRELDQSTFFSTPKTHDLNVRGHPSIPDLARPQRPQKSTSRARAAPSGPSSTQWREWEAGMMRPQIRHHTTSSSLEREAKERRTYMRQAVASPLQRIRSGKKQNSRRRWCSRGPCLDRLRIAKPVPLARLESVRVIG